VNCQGSKGLPIATRLTSKHVTPEEATPDQRACAMGKTPREAHH
jgi:hypothetical protein